MQGMSVQVADAVRWRGPEYWQDHQREQKAQTLLRYERIAELLMPIGCRRSARARSSGRSEGRGPISKGNLSSRRAPDGRYRFVGARPRMQTAPANNRVHRLLVGIRYAATCGLRTQRRAKICRPREHIDNPIKIELHTRIAEPLPIAEVDINRLNITRNAKPGINDYPSLAALMRHLLLHAAGNIRARALRQMQLHDIALLAPRMRRATGANCSLPNERRGLWWALTTAHAYSTLLRRCIPAAVMAAVAPGCPKWLRRVTRRSELTDVSWSKIRIEGVSRH